MSPEALGRAAEKAPSIAGALDRAILEETRARQAAGANVVVDGRIQAHLLAKERIPCLKVLIDAPLEVRARRIAGREKKGVPDAKREIIALEEAERVRYNEIYVYELRDRSVTDV